MASSEVARVTTMPPATETSSAGISVTRPSPTVRIVKCESASRNGMPSWKTPIRNPAMMLIAVISMVASESRWLKRAAPSIAP